MKNRYKVQGDVTIIYCNGRGKMHEVLISTCDLPKVDSFSGSWYLNFQKNGTPYVKISRKVNGKSVIRLLHRVILDEPMGLQGDHKNRNTLDNTRENLRPATAKQNVLNRGITSLGEYPGVYFQDSKYYIQKIVNGKKMFFGRYSNINDAHKIAKLIDSGQLTIYDQTLIASYLQTK